MYEEEESPTLYDQQSTTHEGGQLSNAPSFIVTAHSITTTNEKSTYFGQCTHKQGQNIRNKRYWAKQRKERKMQNKGLPFVSELVKTYTGKDIAGDGKRRKTVMSWLGKARDGDEGRHCNSSAVVQQ